MHAVFYRNLNLGHRRSPTRDQLQFALLDAGAERVRSFQTNGTVLMVASDPEAAVRGASRSLAEKSGYNDAALIRTVASLVNVLDSGSFDGHSDERTYRETFTFFDGGRAPAWSLPWTNARDNVDIIRVTDGLALGVIRKPKNTAGSPTAEIERSTGGVATTRTRGSIERLVKLAANWQ